MNPNTEIYLKIKNITFPEGIYAVILDVDSEKFTQNQGLIYESVELWDNDSDNVVIFYT